MAWQFYGCLYVSLSKAFKQVAAIFKQSSIFSELN